MEESLVWKTSRDKWGYASSHTLSLPPGAHTDDGGAEGAAAWRGETTTPEEDPTARHKRLKRQRKVHNSFRQTVIVHFPYIWIICGCFKVVMKVFII